MLTTTVNTFENIDTKFHNDQSKTIGVMNIYFRGGFTLVELFTLIFSILLQFQEKLISLLASQPPTVQKDSQDPHQQEQWMAIQALYGTMTAVHELTQGVS